MAESWTVQHEARYFEVQKLTIPFIFLGVSLMSTSIPAWTFSLLLITTIIMEHICSHCISRELEFTTLASRSETECRHPFSIDKVKNSIRRITASAYTNNKCYWNYVGAIALLTLFLLYF